MLTFTDMELSFTAYQERQFHEISPAGIAARAQAIHPGGKFSFHAGQWRPEPYVGHALVTMVEGDPANRPLAAQLWSIQNELSYSFADPTTLYLLPEKSFHQTIANTLSAERHHRMVVDRGLDGDFPALVTGAFSDIPEPIHPKPVVMRMVGLSLFSTAIGLLGVFEGEEDLQRVHAFRDHFYGNESIGRLGIRRTRPFIGHITLAYVEGGLDSGDRSRLVDAVCALNRILASQDLRFHLSGVELRSYTHLAEFRPLPGLPTARF